MSLEAYKCVEKVQNLMQNGGRYVKVELQGAMKSAAMIISLYSKVPANVADFIAP